MGNLIKFINDNFSIEDEFQKVLGRPLPKGKFICPNPEHPHSNNTPSCKVYGNGFKCFGYCNRYFGVYDLWKWYAPDLINEVRTKIVIGKSDSPTKEVIKEVKVNRSQPMLRILQEITGICPSSLK